MSDEVRGKCPVCSGQLVPEGPNLKCSVTPGHYEILATLFEELWSNFERSDLSQVNGTRLIEGLLNNNLSANPPQVKLLLDTEIQKSFMEMWVKMPPFKCVICGGVVTPTEDNASSFDMRASVEVGGWYHASHSAEEISQAKNKLTRKEATK